MPNYTTPDVRGDSYPTYGGPGPVTTGATTGRGGLAIDSSGDPYILNRAGTAVLDFPSTAVKGTMAVELSVSGAGNPTGVLASIANPFGYDVIITSAVFRITAAGSTATLDIGVGADATTSNDGLMDGIADSLGLYNNEDNAGINGKSAQVWSSSQFLNVAKAGGNVTNLVGKLHVVCYRA